MKNLFSYEGKRVLAIGCYSGMGEATAKIVRGLGAEVVAVDIKKPSFDYSDYHQVDLRDTAAIDEMLAAVTGAGPLDRIFYCAGLPGNFSPVDVLGVNFIGLRYTVERAVRHLPRDGAIASISSAAGMAYMMSLDKVIPFVSIEDPGEARAWVDKNQSEPWFESYSFSKMCTIVYTFRRSATLVPETGIRLNCISPGPTDTPMMPAFVEGVGKAFMDAYPKPIGNRMSTPEEQGWALAFLNSDAASYVSGENLYTDGGCASGILTGAIAPPIPPQAR